MRARYPPLPPLIFYMHINQLTSLIPASFECQVMNDNGEFVTNTVNIKLNRLSFREATQEQFQQAMKNADKDPEPIGRLLAGYTDAEGVKHPGLLASWEIFEDEAGTQMLPITVENIIDQPFDFVMVLVEAVAAKVFPNPQKAAGSVNGSVPPEKSIATTDSEGDTSSLSLVASGE